MTFEKAQDFLGKTVEVEENSETICFVGHVTDVSENDVDGILISVLDQEDNTWDIEAKYVSIYE